MGNFKYMYLYPKKKIKKDSVMEKKYTSVQSSSFQPLMKNPILRN